MLIEILFPSLSTSFSRKLKESETNQRSQVIALSLSTSTLNWFYACKWRRRGQQGSRQAGQEDEGTRRSQRGLKIFEQE